MSNTYVAPLDDLRFNLEAFGYNEKIQTMERFEDFDLDTSMSLLEEYSKFCVEELLPLNKSADKDEAQYDPETHNVKTANGFIAAYKGFCENGFTTLPFDPEYGGMGAPVTISILGGEVLIATNKSFSMCNGLTTGLIDALEGHGSPEQKQKYLPKLISGEWTGTMCLTEPQCGTDLGLLSTKAEPFGDHYKLTGTKIWITFGEHDMADNIIHLVLARLPDAAPGIRGVSVFLVPKFMDDGSRNPVFCGGLDHKMGIKASPTCVINLEGAEGYLVGEPHKGMRPMFTMMNAARLNVGIEGVALADAAYQSALTFARERRQSRALSPARREKGQAADTILVHPDVRRMLLNIKSTNEPLRGLVTWIAMNYDIWHHSSDPVARETAGDLVALLTPIIKSYGSERGFLNISEAMQVCGGAGYTTDFPIEQYLRDCRIAMIYEGTNHIQALDLVGRKLPMHGGRLMRAFAKEITTILRACAGDERMTPFTDVLKKQSKRLNEVTMKMGAQASMDHELIGAIASNYLNLFALVTLAYIWVVQIKAVIDRPQSDPVRESKLQTARFFFDVVLPETESLVAKIKAGKSSMMDINAELL